MSLATVIHRVSYTGDGSTTAFSFPYKYISSADLVVVLVTTATGAETTKTLTTHYSVTGSGLSNGVYASASITMVTAPTSAQTLVIYRKPSLAQEFAFDSEATPLPVLNRADDRLYMLLQAIYNDSARVSPGSTTAFSPVLPNPKGNAGFALALNGDETGFEYVEEVPTGSVSITSVWQTILATSTLNFSTLTTRPTSLSLGDSPVVDGFSPGALTFDATENSTATSGTIYLTQNVLTVNPAGASTGDFRAQYGRVIVDAGANNVTKAVAGSSYVYHEGTGTIATAFGDNGQIINNDSGTITSGIGDVNYARQESTGGLFTRGVGTSGIATNIGRTAGVAFTAAVGVYGAVDNTVAGTITDGKAIEADIINSGAGTITSSRAVSALTSNTGGGTITTAYGLTARLANTSGTVTDYYGIYIFPNTGTAVASNNYALYSEATQKSYFAGNLGLGDTTPSEAKFVVEQGAESSAALFRLTDNGASGPGLDLELTSASPAASDILGFIRWYGNDSGGNRTNFASISCQVDDATNGSEDGRIRFITSLAGATGVCAYMAGGIVSGAPTGGDKGAGSINAEAVYDDNVLLTCYPFDQWIDGKIDLKKWDDVVPNRVIEGSPKQRVRKVKKEKRPKDVTRVVGGMAVSITEEVEVEVPELSAPIPVFNADGTPKLVQVEEERRDENGIVVSPARFEQATHQEPIYEEIPATPERVIERKHDPLRHFVKRLGTPYDPMTIEGQLKHVRDKRHLTPFPNEQKYNADEPLAVGSWMQRFIEMAELQFIYTAQLYEENKALKARVAKLEAKP